MEGLPIKVDERAASASQKSRLRVDRRNDAGHLLARVARSSNTPISIPL